MGGLVRQSVRLELGRAAVAPPAMRALLNVVTPKTLDLQALASATDANACRFRHSSRSEPLKLSPTPFYQGRPGSM